MTTVDSAARARAAALIEELVQGRISNDQFEAAYPEFSEDLAVTQIMNQIWSLYDDLHEHRLVGAYSLNSIQREGCSRCVLFLSTQLPYEWSSTGRSFLRRLLDSMLGEAPPKGAAGDLEAWPFFRTQDLESAGLGSPLRPESPTASVDQKEPG